MGTRQRFGLERWVGTLICEVLSHVFFKWFESFIFGPYPLIFVAGLLLYWLIKTKHSGWIPRICLAVLLIHMVLINSLTFFLVSFPLRNWIPENTDQRADAIVVHGPSAQKIGAPTSGSSERGYLGAEAFLDGRAPLVLMMGYTATDSLGSAKAMRIIALGMGVPKSQILMSGGRTTYEEAQIGGDLLRKRGIKSIILVTSWYHMPRARAVWEKQGFEILTNTYLPHMNAWAGFFSWGNVGRLKMVCHEYAGMLVYRLRGWL